MDGLSFALEMRELVCARHSIDVLKMKKRREEAMADKEKKNNGRVSIDQRVKRLLSGDGIKGKLAGELLSSLHPLKQKPDHFSDFWSLVFADTVQALSRDEVTYTDIKNALQRTEIMKSNGVSLKSPLFEHALYKMIEARIDSEDVDIEEKAVLIAARSKLREPLESNRVKKPTVKAKVNKPSKVSEPSKHVEIPSTSNAGSGRAPVATPPTTAAVVMPKPAATTPAVAQGQAPQPLAIQQSRPAVPAHQSVVTQQRHDAQDSAKV